MLFRNFPIIVAHASSLNNPGSFVTHDSTGVPILVTRNQAGEVQAFINVCRHRGARLEDRPCGQAKTFSCPYHGWTYDTGGRLRGIRQADNFGAINKEEYRLIRLPAFERYGLIWVRPFPLNRSSEVNELDIDAWLAPMAPQLETLSLENHVLYRSWTLERAMNWHIALEGFQEQYHFCSAHRDTACSAYLDKGRLYRPIPPRATCSTGCEHRATPRVARRQPFLPTALYDPELPLSLQLHSGHDRPRVYPHHHAGLSKSQHLSVPYAHSRGPRVQKQNNTGKPTTKWSDECLMRISKLARAFRAGLSSGANAFFTIGQIENGIQLAKKAIADAIERRVNRVTPARNRASRV